MLNKEINIPTFKVWKLGLVIIVFGLVFLYVLERNSTSELRFKNKLIQEDNTKIKTSLDSLKVIEQKQIKDLKAKDLIIKDYKSKSNYYKNKSKELKKDYEKSINDYNALNSEQRFSATKKLLHE